MFRSRKRISLEGLQQAWWYNFVRAARNHHEHQKWCCLKGKKDAHPARARCHSMKLVGHRTTSCRCNFGCRSYLGKSSRGTALRSYCRSSKFGQESELKLSVAIVGRTRKFGRGLSRIIRWKGLEESSLCSFALRIRWLHYSRRQSKLKKWFHQLVGSCFLKWVVWCFLKLEVWRKSVRYCRARG